MERTIKTRKHYREKSNTQQPKTYSIMPRAASIQYEITSKAKLMVQKVSINAINNLSPIKKELENKISTHKKSFLVQSRSSENIKALKDLKIAFKLPNLEKREPKIKIPRSKSPLTKLGIDNKSFVIEYEKSKQPSHHPTRRASLGKMPFNYSRRTRITNTLSAFYGKVFDNSRAISKHSFRTRTGSLRGVTKRFNQDAYIVQENFANSRNACLYGVFDGHGTYGHTVSNLLKDSIPSFIEIELKNTRNQIYRI